MPNFFVWSRPHVVQLIEAASEQDAAKAFFTFAVTQSPERNIPPDCFVQATGGRDAPDLNGTVVEFWITIDGEPLA